MVPTREHKADINEMMAQSFLRRQEMRKRGATLDEMLNKFPHLGSFDGEVVSSTVFV